jgi:hypothetical protein
MAMKTYGKMLALAAALFGFQGYGRAAEVVNNDQLELNIGGRMQMYGLAQHVDDPHRDNERLYLFIKQARLMFSGRYEETKFRTEIAFGGEEEVQNKNSSLSLLDMSFDFPLVAGSRLMLGQFKVPYGRERLSNSGELLFAERSINNLAFRVGRDVGAVLHGYPGKFALGAGVFTAGGRDVPERYIPEDLGIPMLVARVGYNDGVDEDLFTVRQSLGEVAETQNAVYLNGLYVEDTLIGHSSVLNVKTAEKPLLLNSNWNPFVGRSPLLRGQLTQAGLDAVHRCMLGGVGFSAEVEGNYGRFHNRYGDIELVGGRAQIAAARKNVEVAVRYAFLIPDEDFSASTTTAKAHKITPTDKMIQEITPAFTYHIKRGRSKIVLDAPILVDVPVIVERNIGSYVLTEQPDQTSYVKTGGFVKRQTVVEGRLLYQLSF